MGAAHCCKADNVPLGKDAAVDPCECPTACYETTCIPVEGEDGSTMEAADCEKVDEEPKAREPALILKRSYSGDFLDSCPMAVPSRSRSRSDPCLLSKPAFHELSIEELAELAEAQAGGSSGSTASAKTLPKIPPASKENDACRQCAIEGVPVFFDSFDGCKYCRDCWLSFHGSLPGSPLVRVEVAKCYLEQSLQRAWEESILPGWPPLPERPSPACTSKTSETWSNISVCIRRGVVGPHAREQTLAARDFVGETLRRRYRVLDVIGEGYFTKAFLARDLRDPKKGGLGEVCLKCFHRSLSVETLADLMVIGQRLKDVDSEGESFPVFYDAFYDLAGFTVEALIPGRTCHAVANADPSFFANLVNLSHAARGTLFGLTLLEQAGIVHNDLKPDNIIWVDAPMVGDGSPKLHGHGTPSVRIVDFGCSRLDCREESGRNWNVAEGGAGHLGYASPETSLGLPVTHRSDVWSVGVLLCELHCGRQIWHKEDMTSEDVLTQAIGLCGLRDGFPSSLLRRSPLDVRSLFTPAFMCGRGHFPMTKITEGSKPTGAVEVFKPSHYGLEQILGPEWLTNGKGPLHDMLSAVLVADGDVRPTARELMRTCKFIAPVQQPPLGKPAKKRQVEPSAKQRSSSEPLAAGAAPAPSPRPAAKQSSAEVKPKPKKQSSSKPAEAALEAKQKVSEEASKLAVNKVASNASEETASTKQEATGSTEASAPPKKRVTDDPKQVRRSD
eukprot:TRINITY_DN7540_c0_g1_i2.p1 TRINITY_DN7540_c0_g1~~TRINITY_DN7540_c0_g1_i2.p1  ORF type:complete len:730 (+),score=125.18 TRINITY_DN7540_c0_g1_i2:113-2302(+)